MSRYRHTALISAAALDRTVFEKLPGLIQDLGPIKAANPRTATRLATSLRAGRAARDWDELRDCHLILVSARGGGVERVVSEAREALGQWKRRTVVLIGGPEDSRALQPLADQGAQCASVRLLPELAQTVAVVEGASRAVREVRRCIAPDTRVVAVRPAAAQVCGLAGAHVQMCLTPALESAVALLRCAGLTGGQAWRMVEAYVQSHVRAFRKAGHRAARRLTDERDRKQVLERLSALHAVDPEQAGFLRRVVEAGLRRQGADAGWLAALDDRVATRC